MRTARALVVFWLARRFGLEFEKNFHAGGTRRQCAQFSLRQRFRMSRK
jgi:hypothetical protein